MAAKLKVDELESVDGSTNLILNNSVTMATNKTLPAASLTGNLPAISAANLTAIPAANITGTIAAVSGVNLTALNATNLGSGTVPTARLGSGSASSSVFLSGAGTWIAAGSTSASDLSSGTLPMARLSGTLPALNGSALTNLPGGGKVLQVVNYTLSDSSAIASSSTSYIAATNVEVAITPAATSSKILIWFVTQSYKAANSIRLALYRDGSQVAEIGNWNLAGSALLQFHYLHSPSTTSATTYQIYFKAGGSGSAYLKNNEPNTVSLTAMEIGA
jgi:hypothetical protein